MNSVATIVMLATGVVALANWWSRWHDNERVELVTKPAVTVGMLLLALSVDAFPASARHWVVLGLVGCLAGDIALLPAVDRFIAGLASFLVGHLLFAVAALVVGVSWSRWYLPAVGLAALHTVVGRRILASSGSMRPAVAAYLAIISVMVLVVSLTGRPWAIVGAIAFAISDSILGWNRFVRPLSWSPVAVMATYHLALMGLVLMLLRA